jgi:cupin 2 domain-containing protein
MGTELPLPNITNLFQDVPSARTEELVSVLASNRHVRIERIVSTGQTSPEGFWYDQDEDEWVVVLTGEARLRIEGHSDLLHLRPGDHLTIPAHQKHRVEWTSESQPTIWLAVFLTLDLKNEAVF